MQIHFRSVLFAPGNKPDILRKLPRSNPDVAVLDLEDAVPDTHKAEARSVSSEVGAELAALADAPAVFVRINAVVSAHFEADFDGVPIGAVGVAVPKLESAQHVAAVIEQLDRRGLDQLHIMAGLETGLGVHQAVEILDHPRVSSAYFGAEDFIADMGGIRTRTNDEVLFARSAVALAARITGTAAVDQIVADFGDAERFSEEAAFAKSLGLEGKLCIHPAQVALANAAFTPSEAEIEQAKKLVAAYDDALANGNASIAFEGQMIDEALVRRSRSILAEDSTGTRAPALINEDQEDQGAPQ